MKLGVVGAEEAKFTDATRAQAQNALWTIYRRVQPEEVISGACPLGGIDIWAVEIAREMDIPVREFPPKVNSWRYGYMPRNLLIARHSDAVVCIALRELPPGWTGMTFPQGCYHHDPPATDHVKGGGCWTMKQAARMGKQTRLVIL